MSDKFSSGAINSKQKKTNKQTEIATLNQKGVEKIQTIQKYYDFMHLNKLVCTYYIILPMILQSCWNIITNILEYLVLGVEKEIWHTCSWLWNPNR